MIPLYQLDQFNNIESLYLMFGSACNMQCSHCSQQPIKNSMFRQFITVDSKVYDLMRRYIKYSIEYGVRSYPYTIIFWGGEPLLHWNTIKEIIVSLTKEFDILNQSSFMFQITTNGLLLDEEKVDFINKYKVHVIFSYDAPYPWAVRGYVSDEICALVNKIKSCEVTSLFNAYNYDILLALYCLKAKFPNASLNYNYRLMIPYDIPEEIYAYDWDKIALAIKKFRISYQLKDKIGSYSFEHRFLRNFVAKEGVQRFLRRISVMCDGNVCFSPNFDIKIGKITDDIDILVDREMKMAKSLLSDWCSYCRHIDFCKSPCLLDKKTESGSYITCDNFYLKFYDIFKKEISLLKQPLSITDLNWYQEQQEIMQQRVQEFLLEGQRYKEEHTRFPKKCMINGDKFYG